MKLLTLNSDLILVLFLGHEYNILTTPKLRKVLGFIVMYDLWKSYEMKPEKKIEKSCKIAKDNLVGEWIFGIKI